MNKKQMKIGISFFMTLFFVVLSGLTVQAATGPTLEVGEVRSLGSEARVPVTLYKTQYLTSIHAEIELLSGQHGVTYRSFEPTGVFAGGQFRPTGNNSGNKLIIDFQSQTGKEQNLGTKPIIIGYITYTLSADFKAGTTAGIEIGSVVAKGRSGADVTIDVLNGKIEHKMPIGDVVGNNEPTAAGAMRILQHINGNPIIEEEARLSADVDGDGKLTQADAQAILDYVTGKRTSFLAIQAKELDSAVLKSEYAEQVQGIHGREPYQFKSKGSMPSGLKLDPLTGELTGTPSRAGNYKFTIEVIDAKENLSTREFTLDVIDSNIVSVDKLLPINVPLNGIAALPDKVTVTYKDKTKGQEKVEWDRVDTSVLGKTIVKGKIGDSGFTVNVEVHVVSTNYINTIQVNYFEFLNLHTMIIDVSSEVYKVTIGGISAHYEGNNQFSLGSSSFTKGSNVTILLYDKYGNVLETKVHKLVVN